MSEEKRAAKRLAHEWDRAIRRRPSVEVRTSVKTVAAELADSARLVTTAIARKWRLPEECVGSIACWKSLAAIAENTGQGCSGTVGRYVQKLAPADLIIHDRRHLRLPSVYVLARDGVALRVAADAPGERPGEAPRSKEPERPGEFPRSNPGDLGKSPGRSTWGVTPDRPGELPRAKPYEPGSNTTTPPPHAREREGGHGHAGAREADLADLFTERWCETFAAARSGQAPTTRNGMGECIGWLEAEARRLGVGFEELLDAKLAAYWSEAWPRDPSRNPTPRNLLGQLPRLGAVQTSEPSSGRSDDGGRPDLALVAVQLAERFARRNDTTTRRRAKPEAIQPRAFLAAAELLVGRGGLRPEAPDLGATLERVLERFDGAGLDYHTPGALKGWLEERERGELAAAIGARQRDPKPAKPPRAVFDVELEVDAVSPTPEALAFLAQATAARSGRQAPGDGAGFDEGGPESLVGKSPDDRARRLSPHAPWGAVRDVLGRARELTDDAWCAEVLAPLEKVLDDARGEDAGARAASAIKAGLNAFWKRYAAEADAEPVVGQLLALVDAELERSQVRPRALAKAAPSGAAREARHG